jgi:hypothetical protein
MYSWMHVSVVFLSVLPILTDLNWSWGKRSEASYLLCHVWVQQVQLCWHFVIELFIESWKIFALRLGSHHLMKLALTLRHWPLISNSDTWQVVLGLSSFVVRNFLDSLSVLCKLNRSNALHQISESCGEKNGWLRCFLLIGEHVEHLKEKMWKLLVIEVL